MKSLINYITEAREAKNNLITIWEGDDIPVGGDLDKMFEKLNTFVKANKYMFFLSGIVPGQEVCNWGDDWDTELSSAYMSRKKYNSYKWHKVQLDTKKNCLVVGISFRPEQLSEPTHEVRVWIFNKETSDYFRLDCGVTVGCRNSSFTNPQTDEHIFNAAKLPPLCDAHFISVWNRPRSGFTTGMTKKEYVIPASEILSVIA